MSSSPRRPTPAEPDSAPRAPGRPAVRRIALLATLIFPVGLLAGALLAAGEAWSYLEAGFARVALGALAESVLVATAVAAAGIGVFLVLFLLLRRHAPRLGTLPAALLAAAPAAVPLGLFAGVAVNAARGIRPRDLARLEGLGPNLLLAAALGVAWLAAAWALARWTERVFAPRRAKGGAGASPAGRGLVAAAVVLAAVFVLLQALPRLPGGTPAAARAARPPVLVILVDALRADRLGAVGYPRATTPHLDVLAADSVLFTEAIAQSTFTKTSIASLFTGRFPYQHGVYWGNLEDREGRITSDLLAPSETTWAEVLASRGYLTAAWIQNSHLRPWMGFAQGFVAYHDNQGDADSINGAFLDWLDGPAADEPFFAYLHYIDLHDPYRPDPPYDTLFGDGPGDLYEGVDFARWGAWLEAVRRGEVALDAEDVERLEALYDGLVRYVDERIGEVLEELSRQGLYDETLVVVTSDHGDGFMEHGFISHSTTPYDELVRVPLVVKLPGQRRAGTVVRRQVRLVDVLPTVLDALGVAIPSEVAGCSLMPLVTGRADSLAGRDEAACAYAITEIGVDEDAYPVVAVRTERAKYIHREGGNDELYDLAADPGERNNRLDGRLPAGGDEIPPPGAGGGPEAAGAGTPAGDEAAPLRRLALEVVERRGEREAERVVLDRKTIEELRALGYLD